MLAFEPNTSWKKSLLSKRWKWEAILSVVLLIVCAFLFSHFLDWQETRPGFAWNDPVLALIEPVELSRWIFLCTYGSLILAILLKAKRPNLLLQIVQAYTLMLIIRTFTLTLVPLLAPENIIPLTDPLLDQFIYAGVKLRDLFFSGHVATLFLLTFSFTHSNWRWFFGAIGLVLAAMILMQHVHYSIDVIAAPAVAYLVLVIQRRWQKQRINSEIQIETIRNTQS